MKEYKKYLFYDAIPGSSWRDLLKSRTANFFHQPETIKFFESCKIETFTIAIGENNKLKTLITGIIQKESGIIKSYFTQRAIILGGPLFADDVTPNEITLLISELKKNLKKRTIYIEIRNFCNYSEYINVFSKNKFKYIPHLNFHVNCEDEDSIKKNMSKSKLRQIKKSLKQGATIIESPTETEIKDFYKILQSLYQKKIKTPLFPESFFIRFFKNNIGKFFLVCYENKIVGGIMCPILDSRVIYEWFVCGEDGRYKGIYPSILATWAAMDYANKNGIKHFDFMGAGSPDKDYGVREFKSKFGGELVEHGRFLYIAKPFLYWLGKNGVKLLKRIK